MKKTLALLLCTAAVCLSALTGCQDEKPFSAYQIASSFPDANWILGVPGNELYPGIPEADRTAEQKDQLAVSQYAASWLISKGYIRSGKLNNGMIIEGADEKANDEKAIAVYEGYYQDLLKVDWIAFVEDAKASGDLKLTTSGTISFGYSLYKGSNAQIMPDYSHNFYISY